MLKLSESRLALERITAGEVSPRERERVEEAVTVLIDAAKSTYSVQHINFLPKNFFETPDGRLAQAAWEWLYGGAVLTIKDAAKLLFDMTDEAAAQAGTHRTRINHYLYRRGASAGPLLTRYFVPGDPLTRVRRDEVEKLRRDIAAGIIGPGRLPQNGGLRRSSRRIEATL